MQVDDDEKTRLGTAMIDEYDDDALDEAFQDEIARVRLDVDEHKRLPDDMIIIEPLQPEADFEYDDIETALIVATMLSRDEVDDGIDDEVDKQIVDDDEVDMCIIQVPAQMLLVDIAIVQHIS